MQPLKRAVALDCEMVEVGNGRSALGRVCLLNQDGVVMLDEYVKPQEKVVNYRTQYSGIKPHHLENAPPLGEVVFRVKLLLTNVIIVGHDLKNDFEVLQIPMNESMDLRDTAKWPPFLTREGNARKLKDLARTFLNRTIQDGSAGHDAKQDALACMDLYKLERCRWEPSAEAYAVFHLPKSSLPAWVWTFCEWIWLNSPHGWISTGPIGVFSKEYPDIAATHFGPGKTMTTLKQVASLHSNTFTVTQAEGNSISIKLIEAKDAKQPFIRTLPIATIVAPTTNGNVEGEEEANGSTTTKVNLVNGKFVACLNENEWEGYASVVDEMSEADRLKQEGVEYDALLQLLPDECVQAKRSNLFMWRYVEEFILDIDRPICIRFVDHSLRDMVLSSLVCTQKHIQSALEKVGEFTQDNRASLLGGSFLHRVSAKRNKKGEVIGLTMRMARSNTRSTWLIRDLLCNLSRINRMLPSSILFVGPPATGKTTTIREMCKLLSKNFRVEIVDTTNEIAGGGDAPNEAVGTSRRMMVLKRSEQHQVLIECLQNHAPDVIVVDEIGSKTEANAACEIAQRGVKIMASAHSVSLQSLMKNPILNGLVGGAERVILSNEERKLKNMDHKVVEERSHSPAFDVVIEMHAFNQWVVHQNIGAAVDACLSNSRRSTSEIRSCDRLGRVSIVTLPTCEVGAYFKALASSLLSAESEASTSGFVENHFVPTSSSSSNGGGEKKLLKARRDFGVLEKGN